MQLLLRMPDGQLVQLVQETKAKPAPVTPAPAENGLALAKLVRCARVAVCMATTLPLAAHLPQYEELKFAVIVVRLK